MVSWPTTPVPSSVTPGTSQRQTQVGGVEQGYPTFRHVWSKRVRSFQLIYSKLTTSDLYGLLDFIDNDLNDGLDLFDWTMPIGNAQAITNIDGSAQNVNTAPNNHGLQTGDSVLVSGTVASDGVSTINRSTSSLFVLNDRVPGANSIGGLYQRHFPTMYLDRPNGQVPQAQKLNGRVADQDGLFSLTLRIVERP